MTFGDKAAGKLKEIFLVTLGHFEASDWMNLQDLLSSLYEQEKNADKERLKELLRKTLQVVVLMTDAVEASSKQDVPKLDKLADKLEKLAPQTLADEINALFGIGLPSSRSDK